MERIKSYDMILLAMDDKRNEAREKYIKRINDQINKTLDQNNFGFMIRFCDYPDISILESIQYEMEQQGYRVKLIQENIASMWSLEVLF